jgi:hypothetical protein
MKDESPVPPTTTVEEDLHSASQRKVNLIWEFTQAFIATSITLAFIWAKMTHIDAAALDNTFFMVVGFYFGRTNHQKVGGVTLGR